MSLAEPVTAITDWVLAITSTSLGVLLLRSRGSSRARLLWAIGFLTGGAAATVGGAFHGFAVQLSLADRDWLWSVTVALIGMTIGFMSAAALSSRLNRHGVNTRWLAAGGVLSGIGLVVQQTGLSPAVHFNHNDLYHCIQTVALFFVFRCASLAR